MANDTVELEIRAKALLGDAQSQISAFLKEIENKTDGAAKKSKSLGDEIESFFKKNKESFKAVGEAIGIFTGLVTGAVAAIVAMGVHGAEVHDLQAAFARLTADVGSYDEVLGALRQSTDGVISDTDLMKSTNEGFAMGLRLTKDQMVLTGEAARVLAKSTGIDTTQAFNTLVRAMSIGQERLLRQVNVTIDASKGLDIYAAKMDKSTDTLTENERRMATRNTILEKMKEIVDSNGRAEVDFADKIRQSTTDFTNFWDDLSQSVAHSPVLLAGMDGIKQGFITAFGGDQQKAIKEITKLIGAFAIGLIGVAPVVVESVRLIANGFEGLRAGFNAMMATITQREVDALQFRLSSALKGVSQVHNDVKNIDNLRIALAGAQGRLKSYQDGWDGALDTMDQVDGAMDKVRAALATAEAEMNKATTATDSVTVAAPKAGSAIAQVGDDAYTSTAQLKAFNDQLREIAHGAEQALISAQQTGTKGQLALLENDTKFKIDKIMADKSLKPAQRATEAAAIESAASDQRQAIYEREAEKVSAAQVKSDYDIQQSQIETGQAGIDVKIRSLEVQREAARQAVYIQNLSDDAERDEIDRVNRDFDEKERAARVDASKETSNDLWQLQQERNAVLAGLYMTDVQAQLAANEAEMQDHLRTLTQEGKADKDHVDGTVALYKDKATAIILNNDPIFKAWKALNTDMRDEWASTWDSAFKHETSFLDAALKPFKDFGNALLHIFTSLLVQIEMSFLGPLQNALSRGIGQMLYGGGGGGAAASLFPGGGGGGGNPITTAGQGLLGKYLSGSIFGGGGGGASSASSMAARAASLSGGGEPALDAAGGGGLMNGGLAGIGGSLKSFFTNPWTIGIGAALGIGAWIASASTNETKDAREKFSQAMGYSGTDAMLTDLARTNPQAAAELRVRAFRIIGKHDKNGNAIWMSDVQRAFEHGNVSENATTGELAGLTSQAGRQLGGPGMVYAVAAGVSGTRMPTGTSGGAGGMTVVIQQTNHVTPIDISGFRKFLRDGGGTAEILDHIQQSGAMQVRAQRAIGVA